MAVYYLQRGEIRRQRSYLFQAVRVLLDQRAVHLKADYAKMVDFTLLVQLSYHLCKLGKKIYIFSKLWIYPY